MIGKDRTKKSLSTTATKELMIAYTNNALTGDRKLLVLFLFNNAKEMRLSRMHPESWQVCYFLYICNNMCIIILSTILITFVFTIVLFNNIFFFIIQPPLVG